MISLDKKYKTVDRNEVVLLEIYDNTVFGRVKTDFDGWKSSQWTIDGVNFQYINFNLVEVPEFKVVNLVKLHTKSVNYCGLYLYIPDRINYMATDKDGTVFGYSSKPILEASGNMWVNTDYFDGVKLVFVKYEGDWRQSLQQV